MNELALFSGVGGGILAGHLLGWRTVAAVEVEDYPRRVLLQRQADGILPRFPIWDDVCTFDGKPWKGKVDVISGGFPCQDISCAGKGEGITGERSGLWGEFARIIFQVRPSYVFVENSPMLTLRGLDRVLGDLSEMGYNAKWGIVGADDVGAPHRRKRIWIVADTESLRSGELQNQVGPKGTQNSHELFGISHRLSNGSGWWTTEPRLGRVANGVANRVDRLKAIGNGQVPAVAELAWTILKD
tara:strand:- start:6615 stop:7343 length:729 start_codon:yes stop_codon:yes gene_type:complete